MPNSYQQQQHYELLDNCAIHNCQQQSRAIQLSNTCDREYARQCPVTFFVTEPFFPKGAKQSVKIYPSVRIPVRNVALVSNEVSGTEENSTYKDLIHFQNEENYKTLIIYDCDRTMTNVTR